MQHTSWQREKDQAILLSDAGKQLGSFPQVLGEDVQIALADGTTWEITKDAHRLKAGDFQADCGQKKWNAAKNIAIDLGDKQLTAVNEVRNDWVYLAGEDKVGQFSGGNRGVRQAITEFEADAEVSEQEKIFLSLLTRTVLEARLQRSQLVWTTTMVIMTIAIILTFIF